MFAREGNSPPVLSFFFFFNDTATTEIYTLSLHDALPISRIAVRAGGGSAACYPGAGRGPRAGRDRKSTRLNSSHGYISYAVFCLKKKKKTPPLITTTHSHPSFTRLLHDPYYQKAIDQHAR